MHDVMQSRAWAGRPVEVPFIVPAPTFAIGEIAREFGVTFRALRFYESRGLLTPLRAGTARRYRQADRERLALILRGKKLGFTLDQIACMIRGKADGMSGDLDLDRRRCAEQIDLLEAKKRQIESALAELRLAYASHDGPSHRGHAGMR
jgi:DNA-binding transcriptional MerR regulator